MKDVYEKNAAVLLRESNEGVLSTMSKKFEGYPFGSFTTFTTDRNRTVIIYASGLAQHTKNLLHNSKASLTIYNLKQNGDQQDSQRLTLLGDLVLAADQSFNKKQSNNEEEDFKKIFNELSELEKIMGIKSD